ncbi:DUF2461 domain-containing protein [Flavobacteriaceae bacterium]|jgi:uncharacterized protein (TIGR02453 family)|nr:DUF2461 domain-containing protein [Flavobacteriaceae bacterium]MDA7711432.1 DUF2461 domain-containing protein [Flavobacteriaceae bacterium]
MQVQINPDIFNFFSSLKTNNNREWFDAQKPRFKALEKEFKEIGVALQSKLNETDSIDQLKLFRIYRDVRFSNDKTPFKTHFGMSFSRQKPALRGGYYIHIQPGGSFIATGFWDPSKEDLLRIRKELETDADELRTLMATENFKKAWGNLEGEEVKTAPKGFSKEGANIDLVRKKQYLFIQNFTDEEVLAPDFMTQVLDRFVKIRPFFDYMSSVLTTDLNGVSLL